MALNTNVMDLLANDEALAEKLDATADAQEFMDVLVEAGASKEDAVRFVYQLANSGELNEEDLDTVAGGCKYPLQRLIAKWGYRFSTGKWRVRTWVDEENEVIYAQARSGGEIQTYPFK